jgi:hypothetical protein
VSGFLFRSCRSRGVSFDGVFLVLSRFTRGWINYFGLATMNSKVVSYSGWICRRLRVCLWKQWKCSKARFVALVRFGVSGGFGVAVGYFS